MPTGSPAKLSFHITFEDQETTHQTLAKTAEETLEHVLLKFLAFLLFYSDDLLIEQEVERQPFRPDLVRLDPQSGQPLLWIDCGAVKQEKLLKICQKNRLCAVYILQYPLKRLETYIRSFSRRELPLLGQACGLTFDDGLLEGLSESVRSHNTVQILDRRPQTFLSLILNDRMVETDVHLLPFGN